VSNRGGEYKRNSFEPTQCQGRQPGEHSIRPVLVLVLWMARSRLYSPDMLTEPWAACGSRHHCRRRCGWSSLWPTPRTRSAMVEPNPTPIPRRIRRLPSPTYPSPSQHERCPELLRMPVTGRRISVRLLPPASRCRPRASYLAPDEPDEPNKRPTASHWHLALVAPVQQQETVAHTAGGSSVPAHSREC
jgi:hypothetical protein